MMHHEDKETSLVLVQFETFKAFSSSVACMLLHGVLSILGRPGEPISFPTIPIKLSSLQPMHSTPRLNAVVSRLYQARNIGISWYRLFLPTGHWLEWLQHPCGVPVRLCN